MRFWSSLRTRVMIAAVGAVIVLGGAFVVGVDALLRDELEQAARSECATAAETLARSIGVRIHEAGAGAARSLATGMVGRGHVLAVVVLDEARRPIVAEPAAAATHPRLGAWGQDGELVASLAVRETPACASFRIVRIDAETVGGVWLAFDLRPLEHRLSRFRLFALLLLLGLSGVTMVLATLAAEGLVGSLDAISESAAAVDRGEPEVRHPSSGSEEVQRLGRRVKRLAEHLDAARASVARLASELDRQVRERTREMETTNRRLAEQAHTDLLTGLPNRRSFEVELERTLSLSRRAGQPLSVIMMDLDNFKRYNDTCGHLSGDTVLRSVGAALKARARVYDIVARWGGDEFCILVPGTDPAGAEAAAKRYVIAANEAITDLSRPDVSVALNASAGVACFPGDGDQGQELVALADVALYRVKAGGGGKVLRYEPAADEAGSAGAPAPFDD